MSHADGSGEPNLALARRDRAVGLAPDRAPAGQAKRRERRPIRLLRRRQLRIDVRPWQMGVTIPVAVLLMLVASDYKLRVRPIGESLTASPDLNTLAEIAVYLGVCVVMGRIVLSTRGQRTPSMALMFCTWMYCCYMAATVAWAIYPVLAAVRAWQFVVTLLLVVVIARFGTRKDLHRLAAAYLVLVAGSVVFGMTVHLQRQPLQLHRFNWLHVHPVVAGDYAAIAVVIGVWLILVRLRHAELVPLGYIPLGILLALCLGGLIGTKTRGALGGCAVGLAVLLLMAARRYRWGVAIGGGILVFVGAILALQPVMDYLSRGEDASRITSFNGRTPLWTQAYEMFLARPFTGYGITASRGAFFDNVGLGGAHNAMVNVIVDGGAIGFILWAGVIVLALRRLPGIMKTRAGLVDAPLIGALFAHLIVDGVTYEGMGYVANVCAIWFFVIVGWVAALDRVNAEQGPVRGGSGARSAS